MSIAERVPPHEGEEPSQEELTLRKRLRNLIARVYSTNANERVPGSPDFYADELYKLLTTVRASNQVFAWPGRDEDGDKTYRPGQKIRFAHFDSEGKPKVAAEDVALPETPAALIDALEAFVAGKPWDEVKAALERDPEFEAKEIARSLAENIDAIRSLNQIPKVAETLAAAMPKKRMREDLVQRLVRHFDVMVERQASRASDFRELSWVKGEANRLVESVPELASGSVADALDAAAAELAKHSFEEARTLKELARARKDLQGFEFAFEDLYRSSLEEAAAQAEARIRARAKNGKKS